jgi:hypothetical protein
MESRDIRVRLETNPVLSAPGDLPTKSPFSLTYEVENITIRSDLGSYRPDPIDHLVPDKIYLASGIFHRTIESDGRECVTLRRVIVRVGDRAVVFARIR